MREIKFRGRRTLNGEWVYGNLMIKQADSPVPETSEPYKCYYIVPIDGLDYFEHEVDPSTIGQYTGLKDSNGKEIYEGDIVKGETYLGYIRYGENEPAFFVVSGDYIDKDMFFGIHMYYGFVEDNRLKVIGNIHDNPELLEEGGKQ